MSIREIVSTTGAPSAIGTYSQAVRVGQMVWLSGQIPLDPETMTLVGDNTPEGIAMQIHQAFRNLAVVAEAAGGSLNDAVKVNLYLTDLSHFGKVNEIMANYFVLPYPARAAVGVASLPRGAAFEAEAVLMLPG
ncbi:MAG: Rid family detoxifying hydrolase [Burkholderiaceae bacterium]|jgi:reactive intermediate/imine deaminase|nr:Rid family detoxifying hydrolase [Burkholderiaceae bacterium]